MSPSVRVNLAAASLASLAVLASGCGANEAAETTTTTTTAGPSAAAQGPGSPSRPPLPSLDEVEVRPGEVVEVQGSKMELNPSDAIVSKVIKRDGIWEPLETRVFEAELEPGDVVVDAGANIGYYTLLAARLVGPRGHVYAFEPEPEAFALLARNVALNGYANVTLVPKALGREAGTLELFLARKNRGDHRIYDPSGKRESITVEVVALDAYLREQGVERLDFMKIDTQGAECTILAGASEQLGRPGLSLVMEFTPHSLRQMGEDPRACLEKLAALGYGFADIREWERRVEPTQVEALIARYPEADRKKFTNLLLRREPDR